MNGNSIARTLLIAGLLYLGYWLYFGHKSGRDVQALPAETYLDAPGFQPDVIDAEPGRPLAPPQQGETCTVDGVRYRAELSSRGAGLTHFFLTDSKYAIDMSTTPDIERWRNLRTEFRPQPGAPASDEDQVRYDRMNWRMEPTSPSSCLFAYEDERVRISKTFTAGPRPFELDVVTSITNRADSPKKHTASIEAFAWRTNAEVKGHLGRVSPFQTSLECARDSDVKRKSKDDSDFKKPPYWFDEPLVDRYAAIANYYFAQALIPLGAPPQGADDKPACGILAEQWVSAGQQPSDDSAADVYHAKLEYPERTLGPNETATYRLIAFFGPKERDVLASAGGGAPHLGDLINLGTFSPVAKALVNVIRWIHKSITFGNWGLAIVALTLGLRMALFPLTWKQIQSAIAMRRLKPEIDALNQKFKDDAQAKNLAMMELWRKNKVNPLGGCLPALVQMPIWFALYATLQTAIEFYHTRFLWFADLSAPDPYFVLPLVLGVAMLVQQRIVPQQGMDPVQQKMMNWLMPGVFTFMMLFLPAALGIYMLTNSVLGITQQLVVESLFSRKPPPGGGPSAGGPLAEKGGNKKGDATGRTNKADGSSKARGNIAMPAVALRKGDARV
jgi:YidC/Oxa1 family membrane protein insertase